MLVITLQSHATKVSVCELLSTAELITLWCVSAAVKRTGCDVPMDIENGNWIIQSLFADYRIGVRVTYECEPDYKAVGTTQLECLMPGYWSDYPPKCLAKGCFLFWICCITTRCVRRNFQLKNISVFTLQFADLIFIHSSFIKELI